MFTEIIVLLLCMTLFATSTYGHAHLKRFFAYSVHQQEGNEDNGNNPFDKKIDPEQFREKVVAFCGDYLGGAWTTVDRNRVKLSTLT